jgi:hypothetical protein
VRNKGPFSRLSGLKLNTTWRFQTTIFVKPLRNLKKMPNLKKNRKRNLRDSRKVNGTRRGWSLYCF